MKKHDIEHIRARADFKQSGCASFDLGNSQEISVSCGDYAGENPIDYYGLIYFRPEPSDAAFLKRAQSSLQQLVKMDGITFMPLEDELALDVCFDNSEYKPQVIDEHLGDLYDAVSIFAEIIRKERDEKDFGSGNKEVRKR